jgi:hypothetical protein
MPRVCLERAEKSAGIWPATARRHAATIVLNRMLAGYTLFCPFCLMIRAAIIGASDSIRVNLWRTDEPGRTRRTAFRYGDEDTGPVDEARDKKVDP